MKKTLFLLSTLCLLFMGLQLNAQVIAEFDRANGDPSSPGVNFTVANLTESPLTRGGGLTMNAGGDFNSRGFDQSSEANAIANGDVLTFSVTPAAGYEVTITDLNIRLDRSGTGPPDFAISTTSGALVGGGTITTSGSVHSFSGLSITSTSTVIFQVALWNASNGSAGTADVEGSTFGGTNNITDPGIQILGSVTMVLPVTLTSFTASTQDDRSVMIDWATASESNNDYFALEHSTNSNDFTTLAKVLGAGNSADLLDYDYLHRDVPTGLNYYRLKQVDFDGTFEYSKVITVEIGEKQNLQIWPTIANQHLYFTGEIDQEVSITLFNMMGQAVHTEIVNEDLLQHEVNINTLAKGQYIVRIMTKEGILQTTRFVKL